MRFNYSSTLLLLLLVGCSKAGRSTEILEGHLELVWSVHPEETEEEPWFGVIQDVGVSEDAIYVSDSVREMVIMLDANGSFVKTIGRSGGGPGEFNRPSYITVSPSGHVFVVGTGSGGTWSVNMYTPSGEFVKKLEYIEYLSRGGFMYHRPLAVNDNVMIWSCAPSPGLAGDEIKEFQTPCLVSIHDELAIPLAFHQFPVELEQERQKLVENSRQTLINQFGYLVLEHGPKTGEVLFALESDPYSVRRIVEGEGISSFTYHDVQREELTCVFSASRREHYQNSRSFDSRYIGQHTISPSIITSQIRKYFTFTHTLRGMARIEKQLVLYVEILKEDFPNVPVEERCNLIDQKLYVVNLETEQTEVVVTFSNPIPLQLQGALEDGTLIFSTNDPVPGILAYRIVPN